MLDEATSALDNVSEQVVQASFNGLQKETQMSVIVIAHRLTTISNANKILVLHDGVLKEQGTDRELKQGNSIYANLCRLQGGDGATDKLVPGLEERKSSVGKKLSVARKSSVHSNHDLDEKEAKKEDEVEDEATKAEKQKSSKKKQKYIKQKCGRKTGNTSLT